MYVFCLMLSYNYIVVFCSKMSENLNGIRCYISKWSVLFFCKIFVENQNKENVCPEGSELGEAFPFLLFSWACLSVIQLVFLFLKDSNVSVIQKTENLLKDFFESKCPSLNETNVCYFHKLFLKDAKLMILRVHEDEVKICVKR